MSSEQTTATIAKLIYATVIISTAACIVQVIAGGSMALAIATGVVCGALWLAALVVNHLES